MNPETRTLIQVTIDDFEKTDTELEIQVGKDAKKRKEAMKYFNINIDNLDR